MRGQLLFWPISPGLVPPMAIFFFNDTATPEIYTLSLHDALPIFTSWLPKGTDEGVRLTADAVPVPERLTVCGLPLALSVTASVAARALGTAHVYTPVTLELRIAASA